MPYLKAIIIKMLVRLELLPALAELFALDVHSRDFLKRKKKTSKLQVCFELYAMVEFPEELEGNKIF